MLVLLLSITLWCVVVYSFRVAVFGNPLYVQLVRTEPDALDRVEQVAMGQVLEPQPDEILFLRRFSRTVVLELAVFVLEIALFTYLWLTRVMPWLSFLLLAKNLVLIALSASMAGAQPATEERLFRRLLALPPWLIRLDRASSLASGAGSLVLFLKVNNLIPW
ncbi:MAG: hypothetical protein A3K19_19990 [Lentisphaerae bacterium RIFOXYB12_FULL_65_16]|nr:MAG: hypothetical protein A3K18_01825 [Lentisphaerae bacterium RIFOXYA12_64_32]OGV87034.1 MAG: hypothetical protein A3K19_19990 [Lentisphaerae bacterium RIFOXYB12_FULL_65_16]